MDIVEHLINSNKALGGSIPSSSKAANGRRRQKREKEGQTGGCVSVIHGATGYFGRLWSCRVRDPGTSPHDNRGINYRAKVRLLSVTGSLGGAASYHPRILPSPGLGSLP